MEVDIKHLAKLARLEFNESEHEKFARDMKNIVTMVEKLPEISQITSLVDENNKMELRQDKAEQLFRREELLANAPEVEAGCVLVPKVMD
jgi:aspartyl-tRNA(Asn)/glutamyl-tRNA(Gln) amidotransferase subunit C